MLVSTYLYFRHTASVKASRSFVVQEVVHEALLGTYGTRTRVRVHSVLLYVIMYGHTIYFTCMCSGVHAVGLSSTMCLYTLGTVRISNGGI